MTTPQESFWKSDFGDEYTQRNFFTPGQMDELYKTRHGVSRMEMNEEFLAGLSLGRVLEVGTNMGAQLMLLQRRGQEGLFGIEINDRALKATRKQSPQLNTVKGSAFAIPFKDDSFDLVFTSGVLIHISPRDLVTAMKEICRVSRRYVWGIEHFSAEPQAVAYRSHEEQLWKRDFSALYSQALPSLRLIRERKYVYVDEDDKQDSMFLLEKR